MSATLLSAFYDIDLFCKTEKALNNLNFSSMLDKKAVGSPVSPTSSSFIPGFLRRHSTSNLQALTGSSSSKFPSSSNNNVFNGLKESSTALLNKENKFRDRSFSENGERSQQLINLQQKSGAQINSTRYKTELCRPFEESGACKYGEKCQFAHGFHELRSLTRHPKYKTELCRTFHTIGFCPYGPRCHFIHNAEERRQAPPGSLESRGLQFSNQPRPKLHHSLSFSGFPNHHGLDSPTSRTPPPPSSYGDDLLLLSPPDCANNAFTFSGQELGLLAPLQIPSANNTSSTAAYFRQASPPPLTLQPLRRLSESPVFDAPPSPPDSLSDRDSYLSSSGSLSGSDSPTLDANRRLPIFSRLSISDD
ncbi:mRNA decay activator protein ZFP36L2 [Bombina bombina]|uniref:mRNA decay activator protein ZFP36L2 n=1 Tax=Bombina bombina TaxID=8345 RepID=UPI00235B01F5|nr:mRNA decay activator protein ZFP36L2 [Bombina bombina]